MGGFACDGVGGGPGGVAGFAWKLDATGDAQLLAAAGNTWTLDTTGDCQVVAGTGDAQLVAAGSCVACTGIAQFAPATGSVAGAGDAQFAAAAGNTWTLDTAGPSQCATVDGSAGKACGVYHGPDWLDELLDPSAPVEVFAIMWML